MKGILRWLVLPLITATLLTACNRHKENDGVEVQMGAPASESADAGYLALDIKTIFEKQQPLKQSPWHSDGGDWTFFECVPTKDPSIKILIGTHTRPANTNANTQFPMDWGEALLACDDADVGGRFVETFAQAFHSQVPLSHGNNPTGFLQMQTAVLGTGMSRSPEGGFNQKGTGAWTATKWFLPADSDEPEVFFNFSLADKRAEFSEKDEDYRDDLIQAFIIGLRDGPLPERTPENDPNLTLVGPTVVNWTPIANTNESCRFGPSGGVIAIVASDQLSHSKIYLTSAEQPSGRKLLAQFDGFAAIDQFLTINSETSLLVSETFQKDRLTFSPSDPKKFWTVDTEGKHPIALPHEATNWIAIGNAMSPDGNFLAMHVWQTQSNKKRHRIIQLGDLRDGTWRPVELENADLQLMGWQDGPKGFVLTGNEFGRVPRKPYSLDVATRTLSPLDAIPAEFDSNLSPDRKQSMQLVERDRLIITDTASGQKREFIFNPLDRSDAQHNAIHWVNNRYLVFDGSRPELIDSETLKMNFITDKGSGFEFMQFSPDFRFAFGYKENQYYIGTVKLP